MQDPQVLKQGSWSRVTPEVAGWDQVTFEVTRMRAGEQQTFDADSSERAFVPLSGIVEATVDGQCYDVGGRLSVFEGLGHCLYAPCQTQVTLRATSDVELAIASAPATESHEVKLVTPEDLTTEARGAGNASRQVSTLMAPSFPADRLHIVEVWTPGGNWSSFPPHKHEHDEDSESQLEESYYYRLRDPENGWALQRVYSPDRNFELSEVVRDGDICLIPWGYHTTVAAHGHDLYYLNVLAGKAPKRSLQAAEDPGLSSLRDHWADMEIDSRLPIAPRYPSA